MSHQDRVLDRHERLGFDPLGGRSNQRPSRIQTSHRRAKHLLTVVPQSPSGDELTCASSKTIPMSLPLRERCGPVRGTSTAHLPPPVSSERMPLVGKDNSKSDPSSVRLFWMHILLFLLIGLACELIFVDIPDSLRFAAFFPVVSINYCVLMLLNPIRIATGVKGDFLDLLYVLFRMTAAYACTPTGESFMIFAHLEILRQSPSQRIHDS